MSDLGKEFESSARLRYFSYHHAKLGLTVDLSGMQVERSDLDRLRPLLQAAIACSLQWSERIQQPF